MCMMTLVAAVQMDLRAPQHSRLVPDVFEQGACQAATASLRKGDQIVDI